MAPPDDPSPGRALLHAGVAMLAVALLVGVALGGVALGVVKLSGLGSGGGPGEAAPRSLYIPDLEETDSAQPSQPPKRKKKRRPKPPISLTVSPTEVGAGERIDLRGDYRGGDGATLQVQRREGGTWTDFPVTAEVSGGRFGTWIQTSRTGRSPFRMYDAAADKASNVVVVRVG